MIVALPAIAAVPPPKIRLSQSNVGVSAAPLWFATQYGFFKKYGIEVEPIYVRNSTIQVMALTTGEVQFSHTGGAPTLNAAATGHDDDESVFDVGFGFHNLFLATD
jgi:ABC-type nitrate/sulfonate/bicarbonate transport system substrate-binding protein